MYRNLDALEHKIVFKHNSKNDATIYETFDQVSHLDNVKSMEAADLDEKQDKSIFEFNRRIAIEVFVVQEAKLILSDTYEDKQKIRSVVSTQIVQNKFDYWGSQITGSAKVTMEFGDKKAALTTVTSTVEGFRIKQPDSFDGLGTTGYREHADILGGATAFAVAMSIPIIVKVWPNGKMIPYSLLFGQVARNPAIQYLRFENISPTLKNYLTNE